MITGARDNRTTEAWSTRNLLCIFTVLTDKRHICRLCFSPRSSYGDPSYFDKLRYILRLPVNNKNLKVKKGKTRKKKKTLKSGGKKKTLNALFGYLENVDKNQSFQSHILIEKRKKKLKPYNIRFNFLCFLHSTYFFLSFPQFSNQPSGEKNKK
jgi:hypothetical protein